MKKGSHRHAFYVMKVNFKEITEKIVALYVHQDSIKTQVEVNLLAYLVPLGITRPRMANHIVSRAYLVIFLAQKEAILHVCHVVQDNSKLRMQQIAAFFVSKVCTKIVLLASHPVFPV
jgi:hypothetical protein